MYSTLFTIPYLLVAKYHQSSQYINENVFKTFIISLNS